MQQGIKEFNSLWDRILIELKNRINDEHIFNTFLADSEIHNINNNVIYIIVSTKLAQQVLSTLYFNQITQTVQDCMESNYSISFISRDELKEEIKEEPVQISLFSDSHLRTDMSFDNFIVGNSNKEAFQAATLVSNDKITGWIPNPLFLYSNSGLGKTHLLNAIGNRIKGYNPSKKILYTTAEEFFDEYIHVIKGERQQQQLLDYFRNIDVLLIDDIQFFVGKGKCQELFFTIFSTLINSNKLVVITSDKHPNELKGLESRLVSRFAGGLAISINPPDISTSIQISKLYIKASGMDINRIDESVFSFFAEKFSNNIRELKGAINKLLFYTINIAQVDHINLSNAIEAVSDFLKANENNKKLSEVKIIDVVSNYYSLTPSQLTGNIRTSQIALARHIAMYLMRNLLDCSFDKIGSAFGGKDHSTVMSACKNVEKGLKINPTLQTVVNELKEKLK